MNACSSSTETFNEAPRPNLVVEVEVAYNM